MRKAIIINNERFRITQNPISKLWYDEPVMIMAQNTYRVLSEIRFSYWPADDWEQTWKHVDYSRIAIFRIRPKVTNMSIVERIIEMALKGELS